VVAVVYAVCGNRWAAEDLAHDAFAVAFRRWNEVRTYDRPGTFVRRVALNLACSRMRRLGAEARALARYAARQPPRVEPIEPDDAAFWAEVRHLPRRQREVIVLRYVEELADADIAEILGCSEATVRVHAHRATTTLAKAIDQRGEQR
jgi:RNA polymerase sigma factor (sigma-70 family)